MKKKVFSLMMTLVLAFVGIARASELTVNDGTVTNGFVPVYGYYADAYLKAEFVMPAADLAVMNGANINGLTFYASQTSVSWGAANFQVFLTEVGNTTINAFNGPGTVVYEGALSIVNGLMVVNFTTPYHYNGGNLLVGVYNTAAGSYVTSTWYGVTATGASVQGYNYSSLSSVSPTQRNFLPKTTFTYSGGAALEANLGIACNGNVDILDLGSRPGPVNTPNYAGPIWMAPTSFVMYNDGNVDVSISVLDFTPSDSLFLIVGAELPFVVEAETDANTGVELQVTMVPDAEGIVDRQFVAIYENSRLAKVWPVTAEVYTPECPDVYELALNVSVFPFVNVPSTMTLLHDDYNLPYPLIPDGYDAVYKMTFEQDMLLNASVTAGANGKVALYTSDFYYDQFGMAGPDVENYYDGPQIGVNNAQPFEVLIGDETSTTSMTYCPFHTLWNYSLSESLYLASELEDAGVNSTPMTSLSWYVLSTTCTTPQNGINIWMANVSDAALTTSSHTIDGMTLVYSSDGVLPVAGQWNEFEFNQGTFTWDGQSNVLILCQRSNGSWQGSVNWQTHNPNFAGANYAYNDNNPYDVTASNSMTISSTNRPNIVMKAGGREYIVDGSVEIENMAVIGRPGSNYEYFLVASSTDLDFEVTIDATTLPCPEVAYQPVPADDADEIEPNRVELKWKLGEYTTEWRLVFGTTYYPDNQPNHPQTIITDWSTDLAQSYNVYGLWNNTNYFWRIDERNYIGNGQYCETQGETWGFTTHLNVPQNLRAVDPTVFNDETVTLVWDPVVDRTYRYYYIYRDGVKVGETPVNNIGATTYTDGPLDYNMDGYIYTVTAVYDEGESDFSNEVEVKVSGYGTISGFVYEQDYDIPIPGATVSYTGTDEFGDSHSYSFTTDSNGFYSGAVYAGEYNGQAGKDGYQTSYSPVLPFVNPVAVNYNNTTTPVNYILDENFNPVCGVIAQYYPDSLDPHSPYVKVYWGCGLPGGEIIEDFETGDFSMFDWQIDPTYPWQITTYQPYEGTYCMKSGNQQVLSSSSIMQVTVDIPADGIMSFFGKISSESGWDYGYFYIDGQQKGSYTGEGSWGEKKFDITEGTHTFKWEYTEDFIISQGDDCFYVDYITFYKQPEPAQPGWHTYCESEFNNAVGSNLTSTPSWAYEYPAAFLHNNYAGWQITKVSLFSDNMYSAVGGNYTCRIYVGGTEPANGTMVSTITVDVPSNQNAWVDWDLTTPVSVTGNDPIYVVWTANTTVSSWPAGCCGDLNELGTWWEGGSGWEHLTYGTWTMRHYFTNRAGRSVVVGSAENAPVTAAVADANPLRTGLRTYVKGEDVNANYVVANPNAKRGAEFGNGNTRAFSHYRVYRTSCYNDGPYTEENTQVLSCEVTDTIYIDTYWADPELTPPGVYKWGVGVVYVGNRGEEIAGPITWATPQNVNRTGGTLASASGEMGSNAENTGMNNRDGWYYYDNGVNEDAIGTGGGNFWWGIMIPAGSYTENTLTKVSAYDYMAMTGNVTIYNDGATAPAGAALAQADVTLTGSDVFVETTFASPVSIDPSKNLWIVYYNGSGATYPAAVCDNTGDANGRWVSLDGSTWVDMYTEYGLGYTFMVRAYLENGAGPQPGGDPIQEPRESVIVWSNCLDKDMTLDGLVTVNVLLNSADSPEGTTVSFVNLNDYEQEYYPVAPIELDETGYYVFDSFRKGDYAVLVEHDGYEDILDFVSIWDATDLRYVMTEILNTIDDLYVSYTGFAMWGNMSGGGGGGGTGATTFTEGFEGGLNGWNVLTVLSDGGEWIHSSQNLGGYDYSTLAHSGSGFAMCYSFVDYVGAYNTDSYMYTPQKYDIVNGSTLTFWADNANDSYPENFSVCVATADNPTAADFTQVWSGGAKGTGAGKASVRHDGERYENWRSHSIDLSAYAGQSVYIAFHDVNYDMYEIWIDDVELSAGAKDERHLQHYKVMCTSIDGEPIFNADTEYPFCQVDTDLLVEGETYVCKVAAMYSTGISDWVEYEWEYRSCENFGGTPTGVSVEGNTISWDYPEGPGPGPGGSGSSFVVDFESNGPDGWTVIDGNNDGWTWCQTANIPSTWTYYAGMSLDWYHSASNAICSGSYINGVGALNPDEYFVSPQVTLAAGSTLSFWVAACDAGYPADHFAVCVSDNGTSNWTSVQEWTLTGKKEMTAGDASSRNGKGMTIGTWYNYSVDLSSYAGQKYIAFHHFNCYDQYIMCLDDITLTSGSKGDRNAWDLMMTFTAPEGGHYGVAYDGTNFYTSNWGYSGAAHNFYKYDLSGNMLEGFEIPSCGTLRGMTYDGQYFYGVANSATVYCVDLANHSVVSTFSSSYGAMRGITYDPARDGFWVIGNWSGNLTLIDRAGAVQFVGPAPESASDLAYYADENGVEHVFCFNNANNGVYDYNITTNTLGGSVFDFSNTPGYDAGSSGGCTVGSFNGKIAFIGDLQQSPNLIGIYELRDDDQPGPGPQPGETACLGAMIYVDGEWEAFVPAPENSYTYEGDADEICVRLVYDGAMNGEYFSMSCPECVDANGECASGAPIRGQYVYNSANDFGALISWDATKNVVKYNVYRSTNAVNGYVLIGTVNTLNDKGGYEYYDPITAGTYYYQVTAVHANGCESAPAFAEGTNHRYVMIEVTSIDENKTDVALYPNPTNGNVKIEAEGMTHITVATVLGQVVYDADVNADEIELNMAQFNAGVYMVRIATETGVSTQRVTVVR